MSDGAGPRGTLSGFLVAAAGATALGALSAFGDWVWARFIPDGAVLPGVIHGVVVFVALAVVLGLAGGRTGAVRYLLLRLPLAGLLIAASFYPLARLLGYLPALLVAWVSMWLALAAFEQLVDGPAAWGAAIARGLAAAVGSGLAFWAISDIWTDPGAAPTNYLVRGLLWTAAFLPGFAALLLRR